MAQELISRQAAAEWLSQQLTDKDPEQWALWLRNNANHARRAIYRVPVETVSRAAFYSPAELEKFVEFEKSRQLGTLKLTGRAAEVLQAFGIGQAGSSTQGRKWPGANANLAEHNGRASIQVIISNPLLVFAMTPAEAAEFGKELIEVAQAAQRINGQA